MAVLICCLTLGIFWGCQKKENSTKSPPPVTFATAAAKDVPLTISTFGNCVTIADVTLQAQVTGTLLKYQIAQGAMVKAGDVVAQIDPRPYEAALQEAQGSLDSAKAALANAQVTLTRQKKLYESKTVDIADLQNAEANELQAQGEVLTAEGQLADATINLGYCTIKSPIDGKAGVYQLDAGNLATANTSELMNIQTINPIYVRFTISENDFNQVRQYFSKGGELPVEIMLPGTDGDPIDGKLTFVDNDIDNQTGTLALEATLPNTDARLWPGLFVNVRLILTTLKDAVVIPSQCVMVGQKGEYVFVVNKDNTVTQRLVKVGQRHGDQTVISSDLSSGEKVITAGQLGLNTGMKVTPSVWSDSGVNP